MNVIDILRQRGIHYIESGRNVKRGNLNIHCPWCGDADRSEHLGINIETGAYSCWRNVQHRGPKFHGLLMKLLGCSYEAAVAVLTDTSDLQSVVARLQTHAADETADKPTSAIVPGLRRLATRGNQARFRDYLLKRGYDYQHILNLSDLYQLHVGLFGELNNRIVFPLYVDGMVVGYTGRAIDKGRLRYYSIPGTIVKQNILWYDLLRGGGRRLYVCEGPFDALKIDYVSRMNGIPDRATCLFGVSYTQPQLTRLHEVACGFDELVILFDREATLQAIQLDRALALGRSRILRLQDDVKDPGELRFADVIALSRSQLEPTGANSKGSVR